MEKNLDYKELYALKKIFEKHVDEPEFEKLAQEIQELIEKIWIII